MSETMSRTMAAEIAKRNSVTVLDALAAIEVFHQCGKFLGHPHVEIHADGSGSVVNGRRTSLSATEREVIFRFNNLCELVEESERLMEECGIKWVN